MTPPKSFVLPSDLVVSLTTIPLLLVLVGSRTLAKAVQQLGLASEEIFRGDRLPVLRVSEAETPNANSGENG